MSCYTVQLLWEGTETDWLAARIYEAQYNSALLMLSLKLPEEI